MKMFYEKCPVNPAPEEMMDRLAIIQLIEYDRYCKDYGLPAEQKKCWFEDGTVFATWFKGPIGQFLELSSGPQLASAQHRVNDIVVWLNGDRAVAECMCTLNFRDEMDGELIDLQCFMRLHFRAEKRDGKWGLVYFEGIYEKDRIDRAFLDSNLNISRDEFKKFRPNNWCMSYRSAVQGRDSFAGGLGNADEWAGPDKPETIERLYKESSEWFYEKTGC